MSGFVLGHHAGQPGSQRADIDSRELSGVVLRSNADEHEKKGPGRPASMLALAVSALPLRNDEPLPFIFPSTTDSVHLHPRRSGDQNIRPPRRAAEHKSHQIKVDRRRVDLPS